MAGLIFPLCVIGGVIALLVEIFYPLHRADKELKAAQAETREFVKRYLDTKEKQDLYNQRWKALSRLECAENENEWDVNELYPLIKPIVDTWSLSQLRIDNLIDEDDHRRILRVIDEWKETNH